MFLSHLILFLCCAVSSCHFHTPCCHYFITNHAAIVPYIQSHSAQPPTMLASVGHTEATVLYIYFLSTVFRHFLISIRLLFLMLNRFPLGINKTILYLIPKQKTYFVSFLCKKTHIVLLFSMSTRCCIGFHDDSSHFLLQSEQISIRSSSSDDLSICKAVAGWLGCGCKCRCSCVLNKTLH